MLTEVPSFLRFARVVPNSGSQSLDSDTHFVNLAECLALESEAEIQRMAERRKRFGSAKAERSGESILDLTILDHGRGLVGRHLITFGRRNRAQPMPWHRLSVGSPVVVSNYRHDDGSSLSGVVSKRKPDALQVALDHWPDWEIFRIDLAADEVTRQRMMSAIHTAMDARGRLGEIRRTLLGEREPEFSEAPEIEFFTDLNESQKSAVRFALSARDIAIIHGPPGTGKTTTVVELIVQAIQQGFKVLACAPTNTAVDNMLERLIEHSPTVVRLGHPARVNQALQDHTLDGLVEQSDEMAIIKSMRREADDLFRRADRYTRAQPARGEKAEMRREARQLLGHAKLLEKRTVDSFLEKADVICTTTTLNASLLGDRRFDIVVIDEACQSIEPGCWIPLLRCDRLVLAGDHCQLPPTILSHQAAEAGLKTSLMERLVHHYGDQVTRMLNVQYRMHQRIMDFSAQQFYDGQLSSDAAVASHLLHDLPEIEPAALTQHPILFIDTAGAGWEEEVEPDSLSKMNPREAKLLLRFTDELIGLGLDPKQIAVIAPYAAQARLLRQQNRWENLEIDTVDGFQGREKEAVLISLVRSNARGEIGFLAEARRMNVALTRAKRKLIVIGDSATIGADPFFSQLLDYVQSIDAYRSVWEIADPDQPLG